MPISDITIVELKPQPIVAIRTQTDNIGRTLGQLLPEISRFLTKTKVLAVGMPLAIWYDCTEGVFDMDAAVPVAGPVDGNERIRCGELPGGRAASVIHTGHYDGLVDAWNEFMEAMEDQKLEGTGDPWEVYLTDPGEVPNPDKWETRLFYPLKS